MLELVKESQNMLRQQNAQLLERLSTLDEEIACHYREVEKLVTAVIQTEGLLQEVVKRQATHHEALIISLQNEREKLQSRITAEAIDDDAIATFNTFASKIQPLLSMATFEERREIVRQLGLSFEMHVDESIQQLHVLWNVYQFKLSVNGWDGVTSFRNGG